MYLGPDVVGHQRDDALAVVSMEARAGLARLLPEPAVGVGHDLDVVLQRRSE